MYSFFFSSLSHSFPHSLPTSLSFLFFFTFLPPLLPPHLPNTQVPRAAPTIRGIVSPSSTSLLLSWNPPPPETRNGILNRYIISYRASQGNRTDKSVAAHNTNVTLRGLQIFTEYTVYVAASTKAGVGPANSVTLRTLNDSMWLVVGMCYSFAYAQEEFA